MGLVIKPKVAPAAAPAAVAAPAPTTNPVQAAVAEAEKTGADPYLAGIDAKPPVVEEVVVPPVSETPAAAPVKKGGLTIVKKPTATTEKKEVAAPVETKLKPGDEGFQAQVAATFNMDTVVVNGVSTLVPKQKPSAVVAPKDEASATSPFAGSTTVLNGQGADNPVIATAVASTIKASPPMDAIQQAEQEAGYTILDAIKEMMEGRIGTLMFVNRDSGLSYQVTGHNPKTNITTMLNSEKVKLHPILTDREVAQYLPVWR